MNKLSESQQRVLDSIYYQTNERRPVNTVRSLALRGFLFRDGDMWRVSDRAYELVTKRGPKLICSVCKTYDIVMLDNLSTKQHTRVANVRELVHRGKRRVHCEGSGKRPSVVL